MLFDYYTLKIIWLLFIGVLFIGFAITSGADLGVATLLHCVAKKDIERRLVINSIGPTWGGNQVWFITAGGAIFAAWPIVYAAAFSGFYFAFMLTLLALIFRPPGIDFRSKLPNKTWRCTWDALICFSGIVPLFVFGVAIGNILQGIPFYLDDTLLSHYTGTFWQLLNPFALLVGFCNIMMLSMHGAIFIALKNENKIEERAIKIAKISAILFLISLSAIIVWCIYGINGFILDAIGGLQLNLPPISAAKMVSQAKGAWLHIFDESKNLYSVPATIYLATLFAMYFVHKKRERAALYLSAIAITATLITLIMAIFPFILPSSTMPDHSLTIWDAVSSAKTLNIMFWVVVIFLPIVLTYTAWAYRVVAGKISEEEIVHDTNAY